MRGNDLRVKALALLPAAAWYRLIWGFSAQTAAVSGSLSGRLLYRLLGLLSPAFAASPETARTAAVELLSFFVRKAAHMFLYFVLALLVCFAVCFFSRRIRQRMGLTAFVCALLAGLDEYHQTMVPGRSGELRDVLVDLCGAGIALSFLALPHLAAWCKRSLGVPLPALVPAALALTCLCLALRPAEAHEASALPVWAASRFVPEVSGSYLKFLAPPWRDALFLAACGITGICVPLVGLLAGLERRTVCGICGGTILAMGGLSWGGGAALPLAAAATAALAALCTGAMWRIAAALAPLRRYR